MAKVIFLNNWGESGTMLLQRYAQQTPSNSGKWGKIQGTSNFQEADYYVVMDGISPELCRNIDWSRVIYLQREPESIMPHFMNHDFPKEIFFKGTYDNFYNVPTWWINVPFDELSNMKYPNKTKKISTVTSGKFNSKNYSDRISFLMNFCKYYPDIEVYGRGVSRFVGNSCKGELNYNGNCKLKGLVDYEYSVVLENTKVANSWTEKPADSILSWSLPIYSGDVNFSNFFPEDSFYNLNVQDYDINEIVDFIEKPPSKIQIEALTEARNLLLYRWNLWPALERLIYGE